MLHEAGSLARCPSAATLLPRRRADSIFPFPPSVDIMSVNPVFVALSSFGAEEVIRKGQTHFMAIAAEAGLEGYPS